MNIIFLNLRDLLESKYGHVVPCSPTTIHDIVIRKATMIKEDVKIKLKKSPEYNLIFDEWTSASNRRYLNLISRTSTEELNLGVVEIHETASAENLLALIYDKMTKFEIPREKAKFITCDGAAVNKKIGRVADINLFLCLNHGIHLGVCEVLYEPSSMPKVIESESANLAEVVIQKPVCKDSNLKETLKKMRKMVKKIKQSPKLADLLRTKTNLSVILDVKTRWNSMIHMVRRFIKIRKEINSVFVYEEIDIPIDNSDIESLMQLIEILTPIEKAVVSLSAKNINLCTADLILEKMFHEIEALPVSLLKSKFEEALFTRILQRRTSYSDVLFYFCKSNLGNPVNRFYIEPEKSEILNLLNKIIPAKNLSKTDGNF